MFNIQGMDPSAHSASKCKLPAFIEEHINPNVPIAAFMESWLKHHISDAQVSIPNYQIIRQDRRKRIRGGVIMYIQNSLPVSDVGTYDDDICEAVVCTIKSINTKVAAIYRPPDTNTQSFENLLKFLHKELNSGNDDKFTEFIVMGDLNLPEINWEGNRVNTTTNKSESMFLEFMENNLLSQYITQPTRGRNTLDLFLTNNPNLFLQSSAEETTLSDHNIVSIQTTHDLNSRPKNHSPQFAPHTFRSLNFQKADFEEINSQLSSIDWDYLKSICPIEDYPELFRLTVLQVCMQHAPLKTQQSNKVNPHTRHRNTLRRRKRKVKPQIEALKQKNPNSPKLVKLKAELYDIDRKIAESIEKQNLEIETKAISKIMENPRFFFSYAKRHAKTKSTVGPLLNNDKNLEDDPKKMADLLQQQYSSVFSDPKSNKKKCPCLKNLNITKTLSEIDITTEKIIKAIDEIGIDAACGEDDIPAIVLKNCKHAISNPIMLIWKDSFQYGYIAKQFKTQIITPVHKKASKADPANYRPIALTPHTIKIFERIIRDQLVAHLEDQSLLCKNQHGFRKGRSCLTQLLLHIDTVLNNMLDNKDTDVIYLDYAKAFDKVDHQILLQKLHAYGVRGKLLTWLNSYLSNRHQTVVIDGKHSYEAKVISGVPQGTVLGPVLFIIYLNDLQSCIISSVISSFADDTRIKKSISTIQDTMYLQSDLNNAIDWSDQNNMLLHQDKFELMNHPAGQRNLLQELPFQNEFLEYSTAKGSTLSPQPTVKDLGVTICSDLSWSTHISNIAEAGRRISSWILSVFADRSESTIMPLYKTLVRSRLEYNSPLWNPSKIEDIKHLEGVQRTVTSRIREVKHLCYWDRLKKLNLMSLQRRRERYVIIHVFKILKELTPNDLRMEFHKTKRRGVCCKIPPMSKSCSPRIQRMYDSSFKIMGAKLWNRIPSAIRSKSTLSSFKSALTRYLLSLQDCPPVPGITSSNSLLDIVPGEPPLEAVEDEGGREEGHLMAA